MLKDAGYHTKFLDVYALWVETSPSNKMQQPYNNKTYYSDAPDPASLRPFIHAKQVDET
jgi:hypothetical protein